MEKSVFQRNNQNLGAVQISLQKLGQIKTVELTIADRESQWSLQSTFEVEKGKFILDTAIILQGGWYSFHFEFLNEQGVQFTEEVPHVGVGEVFLVAGQSNAQMEGPRPADERVVAALFDGGREGKPYFFSLNTTEFKRWVWPSPPGTSFLGTLGDSLVNRLKVPVLFFNAAAGGTSTGNWWTSAVYNEPPYFYVDQMLHKFTFDLGLRGVLWMQGESNSIYNSYNASSEVYRDEVFYMVQKMRDTLDFQQLSWVVSLTSWNKAGADPEVGIDPNPWELRKPTRDGQMLLVESDPDIFLGPDTDILEGLANSTLRSDGTHFTAEGFVLVGVLWHRALSDEYFQKSNPYTGRNWPKGQKVEIEKKDQTIVFEEWDLPFNCDWSPLPRVIEADLPFSLALTKDSPAELKGDSIRLTGKAGEIGLIVQNEGNENFNRLSDTLRFITANLTSEPQKIIEPSDYVKGEVIRLQSQCETGEVFWRWPDGKESLNSVIDLVYQEPMEIYSSCKSGSCVNETFAVFNLNGIECDDSEQVQFTGPEYVIVDKMIRRIKSLEMSELIEFIISNNLQKKIYLPESPDKKITLSFNGCKPKSE